MAEPRACVNYETLWTELFNPMQYRIIYKQARVSVRNPDRYSTRRLSKQTRNLKSIDAYLG